MGLKDLLTGGSSKTQSDCCNVEIVPSDEEEAQEGPSTEEPEHEAVTPLARS